jgi:hypothetical protein
LPIDEVGGDLLFVRLVDEQRLDATCSARAAELGSWSRAPAR